MEFNATMEITEIILYDDNKYWHTLVAEHNGKHYLLLETDSGIRFAEGSERISSGYKFAVDTNGNIEFLTDTGKRVAYDMNGNEITFVTDETILEELALLIGSQEDDIPVTRTIYDNRQISDIILDRKQWAGKILLPHSKFSFNHLQAIIEANKDRQDCLDLVFQCVQAFEDYYRDMLEVEMQMKMKPLRDLFACTRSYQDITSTLDQAYTARQKEVIKSVRIMNHLAEKSNIPPLYEGIVSEEEGYCWEVVNEVFRGIQNAR